MPKRKKKGTYIGFKKLSRKIQKSGKSKKSADAIAATVGRKKYGKKRMARKAAAGRARAKKK